MPGESSLRIGIARIELDRTAICRPGIANPAGSVVGSAKREE